MMKCIRTNVVIPKNLTQIGRKRHDAVRFSSGLKKIERERREGRAFILTIYCIMILSRKMDLSLKISQQGFACGTNHCSKIFSVTSV